MSLIDPNNSMAIIAALLVLSALAFALENTWLGRRLTGTVLIIALAVIAANVGLIPHASAGYDMIFTFVVPLLIPLFLMQADLRRVVREAPRTAAAFFIAMVGTVAGVLLAVAVLDLSHLAPAANIAVDRLEPAIAGLFASTYIGGSVNYAALGEMTGLSADRAFFAAATATDNLFSALFLSLLAGLPALQRLARWFPTRDIPDPVTDGSQLVESAPISAQSLCWALALAAFIVVASDAFVTVINMPSLRYIVLTVASVSIATLLPRVREWCAGAFSLGIVLSFTFFAAIAAGADIAAMITVAPILVLLVLILLTVHLSVVLTLGHLLKLSLPELITASNAAILGATTAPALAAAKGWQHQVTPGILVGMLGYALGTLVGAALFNGL